jgi:hypothetical protein
MPLLTSMLVRLDGYSASEPARQAEYSANPSTRAEGTNSMRLDFSNGKRLRRLLRAAIALIFAVSPGCGRSGDAVQGELPEAARKSLFQKKMDVQNRVPLKSRVGKHGTKAPGQLPPS